jgi:SAM-dependent methyltransferase
MVAGLSDLLHLTRGSLVVDIGCGHGRYPLALSERGYEVVGIDFAAPLLMRARHLGTDLGSRASWIRGDMRHLPLRSGCAEAVTLIDSFGFFESDEANETVLEEAARVLSTRGRLGLKVVNATPILTAFREADREERDGAVVAISRTLTVSPPRMTERIHVSGSRGHGEYERRQRLYDVDDLRAALGRAGLTVTGVFGTAEGATFEPMASSTMWIVAQR